MDSLVRAFAAPAVAHVCSEYYHGLTPATVAIVMAIAGAIVAWLAFEYGYSHGRDADAGELIARALARNERREPRL